MTFDNFQPSGIPPREEISYRLCMYLLDNIIIFGVRSSFLCNKLSSRYESPAPAARARRVSNELVGAAAAGNSYAGALRGRDPARMTGTRTPPPPATTAPPPRPPPPPPSR